MDKQFISGQRKIDKTDKVEGLSADFVRETVNEGSYSLSPLIAAAVLEVHVGNMSF